MSFETGDELFEGIQIMTPSELNSAITEDNSGEKKEPTASTGAVEDELTIVPVVTETGDTGTTKEQTVTKTETTDSSASTEKNEAVFKALIQTLVDEGVITVAEQEKLAEMPGNVESIKKLMADTIEENVKEKQETWKKSLTPEKRRFLEIEGAFDQTDQAILMAQRLEFFDNLTDDQISGNEKLAQQLHYEQLTSLKNFSHEEAMEAVEEATKAGKIVEKAIKAAPELKTQATTIVEQAKEAKEAKTKEEIAAQTKAFESLLSAIDAKESFIDGLNLNKTSREKLKNNIVNPVYKDPKSGKEYNSLMYKQMKNPAEFEMILNYYDTLGLFNIDKDGKFRPDISKIKAIAKTQAITELDRVIASEDERGVGRNTSVETSEKTKSALDFFEKAFGKK